MSRIVRVAGAQMGGTQKADSRKHTMDRLIALLRWAAVAPLRAAACVAGLLCLGAAAAAAIGGPGSGGTACWTTSALSWVVSCPAITHGVSAPSASDAQPSAATPRHPSTIASGRA